MFGTINNKRAILALLLCCMIILAGLSGCVTLPAEKAPSAEEEPLVAQVSATIKLKATSSTWREDKQPYDIYSATKEKLERVGFKVVSEESDSYDATLFIDYEETKGGEYIGGGYGTRIGCALKLHDKTDNLLFEKEMLASTSFMVRGTTLYMDAVKDFESEVYFKYLGEIIATKFGVGDEVSVLITALKDEDSDVRRKAAEVMDEIGDARVVEPLIQALKDEDGSVRSNAAFALGEIGDKRAVEPLIQTLGDENNTIRRRAAEALGKIGDERAVEPLTNALEDEISLVQKAAREALEKIQAAVSTPPAEPPAPEPVNGDEGKRTIVAPRLQNTVTLDGGISGNEWDDAGQLSLNFVYNNGESSTTYPGTIYLKHDGVYLWICIRVQDDDENKYPQMYDYAAILFDANGDGGIGPGDDSAILHHGLGSLDLRPDEREVWLSDTEFGGNSDVGGESRWAAGWYTYEMRKPLNSGDTKGYDIAISPGDTILSSSCFWDAGEATGWSADAGSFYIRLEP